MTLRFSAWATPLAFTFAGVLLTAPVGGQSRPVAARKWQAPRTPFGQPDLQGIWSNVLTGMA